MKFTKLLAAAALAALTFFTSCEKEEQLGAAAVSVDPVEASLTAEAGATATVNLKATRDWTVTGVPDWLVVEPSSGKGSNSAKTIKLTAKSNPGIEREANITFTIGFSDAVLKVKQAGEAGTAAEALLYRNNFDKEEVAKTSSGGWPYLDQTECWKNESGNGIEGVKYEFATMSVRNSGKLSDDATGYSLYAGSGHNKLFFGKQGKFAVKNIALGGKTSLELSFGGQRYSQDDKDNTFSSDEFKVYVSIDGLKGVEVPITFASGSAPVGNWDLASAKFAVPAGTEALAVVFSIPAVLANNAYSIDDLQLIASGEATALDFTNAVDLGLDASELIPDGDEVTSLATIVAKASGTDVTVLNATVTAVTTKGYVISDGTTSIYVYKNADPKLAVGDKVSIIGKFQYYWGEYEISGASEKKTGTATPVYPTPNEVNATFLARTKQTAAVDEASTNYQGMWYPVYAHVNAKVHKDGNYTQFLVDGCTDPISFVSAPSKMFQDASGTEWGEGNEVEILGYYGGWVAPTDDRAGYHQFIAVSVTGQATYKPVEAAVAGDDIFIATNAAHDLNVTNGNAFTNPVTVGDASFSFDGGGNNGKYYTAGTAVRIYSGGSVKIASSRPIIKIEYLFAPSDNNGTYSPVDADVAKLFTAGTPAWNAETRVLTWTGKAMEVVLTYPLTGGNYRFQQIGITYGQDVEARLSATPLTLSVSAEDQTAAFKVQSNVAWTITSDTAEATVNPASGEGDKDIAVSFPKNTSTEKEVVMKFTVSANGVNDVVVTITQDKAVDMTQATDLSTITALTSGTVNVNLATVVAVTSKGCIISDGTNHVYIYKNGAPGVEIGDVINVSGTIGQYNGGYQIGSPTITKTGLTAEPAYGTPVDISESYATYSNANKHPAYVTFVATPKKSGNYTNLYFEGGDSPYASFVNAASTLYDDIDLGAKYRFTGFYTGKASAYHQIVYVSKEKLGEAAPELKVETNPINVAASATSATINITANVAWSAALTSGTAELAGADGTTGSPVTGNGNGKVMVGFAANTDTENAKTYTVTISGEGVENVVVTINQAKAVAQGGGSWVRVTNAADVLAGGKFIIGYEERASSGVIVPMRNDGGTASLTADGYFWSGTVAENGNTGTIDMATVTETGAYEVTIAAHASVANAVTIKAGDNYIGLRKSTSTSSNKNSGTATNDKGSVTAFKVTAGTSDTFTIKCENEAQTTYHTLQYNTSSPRFSMYNGGQKNPVIYKWVAAE